MACGEQVAIDVAMVAAGEAGYLDAAIRVGAGGDTLRSACRTSGVRYGSAGAMSWKAHARLLFNLKSVSFIFTIVV